jgi:SAM-dependent methyltransferase
VFASETAGANEYAIQDAAQIHDNALRWVFETFSIDEEGLRSRIISRLALKPGQTVLITGAGAGNDLPHLARAMGNSGVIYAQDIALEMLIAGIDRFGRDVEKAGIPVHFSASDATNLPFPDASFDAVYHFGGINLFPDVKAGIMEMNRVARSGGKVVFCDEGLAPWLKATEYGRMLMSNNALYAMDIPLSLLPENARDVKLTWEVGNCFYVVEFNTSDKPLPLNIDVPHVGKRGGSVRKRHYGKLEGVDPELRDKVYAEAERQGISRVELIERLLRAGVKG